MSNYVYLGILAKFHAGQLYSASLISLLLKKCQAEWMVGGFFLLKLYLIENEVFHFFFLNFKRHFFHTSPFIKC